MTNASAAGQPGLSPAMVLSDAPPMYPGPPGMLFFYWGLTFLASYNVYMAATASWQLWRQPQRLQQEVEKWSDVAGFTVGPKAFVTGLWAGLMVIVMVCVLFMKHAGPMLHSS